LLQHGERRIGVERRILYVYKRYISFSQQRRVEEWKEWRTKRKRCPISIIMHRRRYVYVSSESALLLN
jgi:hypothetical protein